MELFKKKQPKSTEKQKTVISIIDLYNEFSSIALEAEYNQLQEDFKTNPSEKISKRLQIIAKVLNDRAYDQGNGKLFNEAKDMLPSFTKEKFDIMTKDEKDSLQKLINSKKQLDESIRKLNEPEPEQIEITVNLNEDPKENEVIETPREKKTLINQIEVEDNPTPIIDIEPKPKKPGFFKKKVKKTTEYETDKPFARDELLEQSAKPQKKQSIFSKPIGDVFKKKVTPEQKQRAVKMQQATEAKHKDGASLMKGVFNKKEKKEKIKLPDVICPDCTHPLKAHQSKGEATGCKCGCLRTIYDIAKKQGISLQDPKEVLTRIMEENTKPVEPEVEPELIEAIEKQAKQLSTLKKETKPSVQKPKIKEEITMTEPPRKAQSLCANCDHVPKSHFDGTEFCTVIGCTCDNYRAYPE